MSASFMIVGGDFDLRKQKAFQKIEELTGEGDWTKSANPDLITFDSQEFIGIQEIRWLQQKLAYKPFIKKNKVGLFFQGEKLTEEAQNALLKILEEPPDQTYLLILSPNRGWLLPTIVSRCQIIQLPEKPQLFLSESEVDKLTKDLKIITSSKIGEKWQWLEKLGILQDRQSAINWLDKMIFCSRSLLIERFLKNQKKTDSSLKIVEILKAFLLYKNFLQANTNLKLTLDNLFLDLSEA